MLILYHYLSIYFNRELTFENRSITFPIKLTSMQIAFSPVYIYN